MKGDSKTGLNKLYNFILNLQSSIVTVVKTLELLD